MKYIAMIAMIWLLGCGGTQEQAGNTQTREPITTQTEEENSTVTHIRVLPIDANSKIPEYLVKLPLQTH